MDVLIVTMLDIISRPLPETNDKVIRAENERKETLPQLRPSIFPNVPAFINFLTPQQKYEKFVRLDIPWNLWTACHNPLLIRCMVRAGFKAKQVNLFV